MAKSRSARGVTPAAGSNVVRMIAFDAGKSSRRLKGVQTTTAALNSQIRRYGKTVVARSRYLTKNNPYAAAAKEAFVSALIGDGIKPSSLIEDADLRKRVVTAFLDWTDECDADGLTDFYGLQAMGGGEMFEAGEFFVRFRPRRPSDGLLVPLQIQILPAEMLDVSLNQELPNGNRIEMGVEFDAIGRRVSYHFWRQHPGNDAFSRGLVERTIVPAEDVIHCFKPEAGQVRGLPHTVSAIAKLAMMDLYDDAELERKKIATLFAAFVTRPAADDQHPLEEGITAALTEGNVALEPGAIGDLLPGEDIKFATPSDVGGNYEAFEYRNLLSIASGLGVPYAEMTGDHARANYSSMRAAAMSHRRRIAAIQNHVMIFQFCRRVWQRWLKEAALSGAIEGLTPSFYEANRRDLQRARFIPPRWEWVDPTKDRQAELLAVRAGFKSLSDVIEAEGYDTEETLGRIKADLDLLDSLGLVLDSDPRKTSRAGLAQARPAGTTLPDTDTAAGDGPPDPNEE